jgi:hypothetical protein
MRVPLEKSNQRIDYWMHTILIFINTQRAGDLTAAPKSKLEWDGIIETDCDGRLVNSSTVQLLTDASFANDNYASRDRHCASSSSDELIIVP